MTYLPTGDECQIKESRNPASPTDILNKKIALSLIDNFFRL